jgi:hypothetical protein
MPPCTAPRRNRTLQLRPNSMSTPVVFAEKLVGQEWRVAVPVLALAHTRRTRHLAFPAALSV